MGLRHRNLQGSQLNSQWEPPQGQAPQYEQAYPIRWPAPIRPARMPLMRPRQGRIVCGVCKGISLHLGIGVGWVRLVALLSAFTIVGVIPYVFLWLVLPTGDPSTSIPVRPTSQAPLARGNTTIGTEQEADKSRETTLSQSLKQTSRARLAAGIGIILLLISFFMLNSGMKPEIIFPGILFLMGIGLSWVQTEDKGFRIPLFLTSLCLIILAIVIFLLATLPLKQAMTMLGLAGVLLLGIAAIAVPWIDFLIHQLSSERAMKEREEERADMAAHLHDGVLQTLALIQLHADDPQTVFTLARSQERDLRNWLYQDRTPSDRSVKAGLRDIAAQVEDTSGCPIEVVTVGDALPCAQTDALLDASRQALVNAVTHGGEPISAYCEAGKSKVEIFVRDHGSGFDMGKVPEDRLGIRQSIIGRIKRRGGTVEIVSRPDWGTEVRMHMPLSTASQEASNHNPDQDRHSTSSASNNQIGTNSPIDPRTET